MAGFFPRDVVHWADEHLHPLRAFSLRTIELAGLTGVLLRLFRAVVLGTSGLFVLVTGVVAGVIFLCGMLTWHLGNYPLRHWPMRLMGFAIVEITAELGMSTLLIAFGRERYGSGIATWIDWWPMAGNTAVGRIVVLGLYALVLAGTVKLVRRMVDKREATAVRT
jgi:hypothetical protein